MFLEKIDSPEDVRRLRREDLPTLADETRAALIGKLSATGGHVGSNLGVVELAVALHYVFSSPADKIVWDVSHQCYAHKILTGRREAYTDPDRFGEVTGFTNPAESGHDFFLVGHSATGVSMALGLARGRDLSGGTENIIAVVGDGAVSGGESMEGLNYAGEYGKNLIVVLNDNGQSVAESHGGLYPVLRRLRETGGQYADNPFKGLGLDYRYLDEGNDVLKLVDLLESVKGIDHPVVLHIHTVKGKGLPYAETDRENWHSGAPFHIADGSPKNGRPIYDTTVHDSLTELLEEDPRSAVLTAGTPRALGFVGEEREKWAKAGRFIDVGIAEENAAAIASGIAKYGGTAVFGVYAAFLQRAYDQLSHDICLNDNPAVILALLPGVFGMKSNTHLALCDIQMLTHLPNLVYLTPSTREEYRSMFRFAVRQKAHPVAIRVPPRFYEDGAPDDTDYSAVNRAKVLRRGSGTALIAVGSLIPMANEIAEVWERETGIGVTVINPIFLTGVDEALLEELKRDHGLVITLEDGELDGGYGQRIASYYGMSDMKVRNLGISKAFHSDFNALDLLEENGVSVRNVLSLIRQFHQSNHTNDHD